MKYLKKKNNIPPISRTMSGLQDPAISPPKSFGANYVYGMRVSNIKVLVKLIESARNICF
jgi:hypothetical protein